MPVEVEFKRGDLVRISDGKKFYLGRVHSVDYHEKKQNFIRVKYVNEDCELAEVVAVPSKVTKL